MYTYVGFILIGIPSACILGVLVKHWLNGHRYYGIEMQGRHCGRGVNLHGYDSPQQAAEAGRDWARRRENGFKE
jgi:hypothetical protein